MTHTELFLSSQRCCIACGTRISNLNFSGRDGKFRCPSCGSMYVRQQRGRRSESIRVYFGDNIF